MLIQNLGYSRIGANRELKKASEKYWVGKISKQELLVAGSLERKNNWQTQMDANIDLISCNDFSFYDQVLDMSLMLNAIPERFYPLSNILADIDLYFALCRGYQDQTHDVVAMEMTKWFDTNYHYIVPEFIKNQSFSLSNNKAVKEYLEAKSFGVPNPKPVLLGPVTYLLLGKETESGFHRLQLVNKLLPDYIELIAELIAQGCEYIQLDEPFLVTALDEQAKAAYNHVYAEIRKKFPKLTIVLASYFDDLGDNTALATNLPINILHIDLVGGAEQLESVLAQTPELLTLSLGLVDGRNIWKNSYSDSLVEINKAITALGQDRVIIAPSCSLMHCPYNLELETNEEALPNEVKRWMAFAKQKLNELNEIRSLVLNATANEKLLEENSQAFVLRKKSTLVNKPEIQKKAKELSEGNIARNNTLEKRIQKQNEKYNFGLYPTTTIGSFPQTAEVHLKRNEFKKGKLTSQDYELFLKKETEKAICWQEKAGLDVLVHGEFERNDMVEYFGELLDGFAFTQNGWVQSYGSRGVKPPVIYGDVKRKEPMTLKWSSYAQSLTPKKVKGMLTGPVTILQWSFVRNDQPRKLTTFQIANALREEVLDMERAGIDIIQIDEPALREGLPLKKQKHEEYLNWAVKAFRICSLGVKDETQIHTHMCYCNFNDVIGAIAEMDADVISMETSRSHMELLKSFKDFKYPNQIGPGVYDIHSPRIPSVEEMKELIREAGQFIPIQNIWINPDCGLKTRNWEEVRPAIENMVNAAASLKQPIH